MTMLNQPLARSLRACVYTAVLLGLTACGDSDALRGAGTWRVINYWALWCTPCREEIPELNKLAHEAGVTVLGVNFDNKQGDALSADISALNIEFPQLTEDPAGRLGTERPQVLPTTLIVDPAGQLVLTLTGPQTETDLLAALDAARKR